MTRTLDLRTKPLSAQAAWSRRVRRIGGFIQAAFAGFWLIRGSLVLHGRASAVVPALAVLAVVGAFGYGFKATAAIAPRPSGSEARHIERALTIATVIQLVASFAAPAIVIAAGKPNWTLPAIAITIGPLLLWLDQRVVIPRYRPVAWALILVPLLFVATMSGTALVATTGLAAGTLLLVTALAGFHDLARIRNLAAVDSQRGDKIEVRALAQRGTGPNRRDRA
jgi:hypothetical protein